MWWAGLLAVFTFSWFWNCQYHVCFRERANKFNWDSKSLGAKTDLYCFSVLFEAIILSVIGGIIGLLLVWIISLILTNALDFEFVLREILF
jgi:putative ABC transport system permease protein